MNVTLRQKKNDPCLLEVVMVLLGSKTHATHVVAELAGGEQGLDGGPEAHDVEHGTRG
jgi:hypothetical protein